MSKCKLCQRKAEKVCYERASAKNIAAREGKEIEKHAQRRGKRPLHDVILDLAGDPCKECCRCGEIKSIDDYYTDISKATGKAAACKKCWVKDGIVSRRHQLTYNFNMRIALALRDRLSKVLKVQHVPKSQGVLQMLGRVSEFRKYLEANFEEGMTWENYGKWHLGHQLPCCMFHLSRIEEQYRCFHFTNILPEWGVDNLRKGGKFTQEEDILSSLYMLYL